MHRPIALHYHIERGFCRALEADCALYNIGIRGENQGQDQGQGLTHPA